MAKKYLLYIHDEKFEAEPKKSELINALLATHYDEPIVLPKTKPITVKLQPKEDKFKMCKNGHILSESGRCLSKGCKYSG